MLEAENRHLKDQAVSHPHPDRGRSSPTADIHVEIALALTLPCKVGAMIEVLEDNEEVIAGLRGELDSQQEVVQVLKAALEVTTHDCIAPRAYIWSGVQPWDTVLIACAQVNRRKTMNALFQGADGEVTLFDPAQNCTLVCTPYL